MQGESVADAFGTVVSESQVGFDCVGQCCIRRHNIQEFGVGKIQLYSIGNSQKISGFFLVATVVIILLTGKEGGVVVSS